MKLVYYTYRKNLFIAVRLDGSVGRTVLLCHHR